MDKMKDPKVLIPLIVSVILGIAMALFADLKPIVVEICAKVSPPIEQPAQPVPNQADAPVDDLK